MEFIGVTEFVTVVSMVTIENELLNHMPLTDCGCPA